jgi:hypothetical protein
MQPFASAGAGVAPTRAAAKPTVAANAEQRFKAALQSVIVISITNPT